MGRCSWAVAIGAGMHVSGVGCSGPPGLGRTLGADLGTFQVEADETTNSCGADALGRAPSFAFDVELARADTELFWDGHVGGTIRASLQFEFATRVSVSLRPARAVDPGCAIARTDRIVGALRADPAGDLTAFSAAMSYDFSLELGSQCSLDEGAGAGLERLPCSMSYELDGRRTRAPSGAE